VPFVQQPRKIHLTQILGLQTSIVGRNYIHGILDCLFYGSSFMQEAMPMQSRHNIFVAKAPLQCN